MFNTRIASAALLSVAVTMAIQAYAEEGDTGASNPIDATGTLPAAKPGECYAKVLVPAEFEVRPEEIEVQPEQETTELVQATFDVEDKEVQVRPEYTTLKVISPKYRTEKEEVEVEPARTEWVTRLDRKGIPASPALLVAAKTSGVDIDDAIELYEQAQRYEFINIQGLDCHIGSQLTDVSPFLDALDKVLDLIAKLNDRGIEIAHLDLGGGVGIRYDDEVTIDIAAYVGEMLKRVGNLEIILEPGRAIVGNAGVFVTKVEFLKQNSDKSFAIIDGAMNDLLRPAFYNAYHQVLPVNDNANGVEASWDLVGPICETGDFLAKDRQLSLSEGDYLAVMSAGAYGFTMSSNYNSRPRVAEVMVADDAHHLIRKRENIQDLFNTEAIIND